VSPEGYGEVKVFDESKSGKESPATKTRAAPKKASRKR